MTTNPATYSSRGAHVQQIMYFRKTFNFSDAAISTGIKFGRLSQNAFITGVKVEIGTVFNAGTTNVLTVGTTSASANEIVSAADVNEAALGVTDVTRGLGTTLTAAAEVDLYYKFTQTGTAATTGQGTVVITFATNNDQ